MDDRNLGAANVVPTKDARWIPEAMGCGPAEFAPRNLEEHRASHRLHDGDREWSRATMAARLLEDDGRRGTRRSSPVRGFRLLSLGTTWAVCPVIANRPKKADLFVRGSSTGSLLSIRDKSVGVVPATRGSVLDRLLRIGTWGIAWASCFGPTSCEDCGVRAA